VTAEVDGVDQSECQKLEFHNARSFRTEISFDATESAWGPSSVSVRDIRVQGEMRRKTFGGVLRGFSTPVDVSVVRTSVDYNGGSVSIRLSPATQSMN